jgi:hypothetical protein
MCTAAEVTGAASTRPIIPIRQPAAIVTTSTTSGFSSSAADEEPGRPAELLEPGRRCEGVSQTARLVGIEFELWLGGRFSHARGPSKQRSRIRLIAPMG